MGLVLLVCATAAAEINKKLKTIRFFKTSSFRNINLSMGGLDPPIQS
jgi:hypothetical protein